MAAKKQIKVVVVTADNKHLDVTVDSDTSISALQKAIHDAHPLQTSRPADQILVVQGKTIAWGLTSGADDKKLSQVGVVDKVEIDFKKAAGAKTQATPTMVINGEEDEGNMVKLPCNHWISPDALTAYIRYVLGLGRLSVLCPYKPPAPQGLHLIKLFLSLTNKKKKHYLQQQLPVARS
jgi:hypothetical protein